MLQKSVSGIVGHPVDATVEAIYDALKDYEESHEGEWFSFHQFDVNKD